VIVHSSLALPALLYWLTEKPLIRTVTAIAEAEASAGAGEAQSAV